jgi:ABC-type phosphate/phosphonate transport system substrate-binding protein
MAVDPRSNPHAADHLHAALPMYDWPETASGWDALWAATRAELAHAGIETEDRLQRDGDFHAGWLAPGLILGQSCGWPYVSYLRGQVTPFARFDFGLSTARPGDYYSVFVMRADNAITCDRPRDLAPVLTDPATIIAVNDLMSQSGFRALGECLSSPVTVPERRLLMTGSHRDSLRAVAGGRARIAAIDAVTWQFACDHEPAASNLSVIARSAEAPGLPLILSHKLRHHRDAVFRAIEHALGALPDEARHALKLNGVVPAHDEDYRVLPEPPYGNLRVG